MRKGILKLRMKNILFNFIYALLNLILTILLFENNLVLTSLLLVLSIIGLIFWKSKITFIIWSVWAIGGPLLEIICVYVGVWNYTNPNFYGVPIWLGFLWGNTAAYIYEFSKELKYFGVKEK